MGVFTFSVSEFLIHGFLTNRFQRVLLFEWLPVKAGVPQGSILGLCFFLIYINDFSENIESSAKLFGDDICQWYMIITLQQRY